MGICESCGNYAEKLNCFEDMLLCRDCWEETTRSCGTETKEWLFWRSGHAP